MGVTKTILKAGNGVDKPKTGDDVVIDYTGCLYDPAAADKHYMGDDTLDHEPLPIENLNSSLWQHFRLILGPYTIKAGMRRF
ncbi:hypothetical protein RJZ90_001407 [Blastomyces dermatitidis]